MVTNGVRPLSYIPGLKPYEPGKPIEEVERELGVPNAAKLASNENPLGPSPKALTAIQGALGTLHRYPDGPAWALRQRLARHLGVRPEMLLIGNGSDELIDIIIQTFVGSGGEILTAAPSFLEYRLIAEGHGARCVDVPLTHFRYDLERMLKRVSRRTKAVFIANPNNPTGTYVTHEEVARFLARLPRAIPVVFDEAYYEFVEESDFPRGLELQKRSPVIILRTFSKAYGLSGIRVGYGIARPEWVGWMNRVRQPFNVNRLAQVAALAALDDREHLKRTQAVVRDGKRFLVQALEAFGWRSVPSAANFILVDTGRDADRLFQALLRAGVIVRSMAAYGLPHHVRITVGTMLENRKLVNALAQVLESTR